MARPIPKKLREEMANDPYYKQCCITGGTQDIEWHHNFIFGGKAINEKWCILPLTKTIHAIEKRKDIKERLNWIMYNRADDETLKRYSKAIDLVKEKQRLKKIYEEK